MDAALLSSQKHTWRTPETVLDPVRRFCGGNIQCDPCSGPGSLVNAGLEYWLERGEDGLTLPWKSTSYVNPPYGRAQKCWAVRSALLWFTESIESLLLIPARPDTVLWQDEVLAAPAICFWRGRIRFVDAPAPAPFPSAMIYYGDRVNRFVDVFSKHGRVTVNL